MNNFDYEYEVCGAPVIYSDLPETPHNPLNRPDISYKKPLLSIIGLPLIVSSSILCSKLFLADMFYEIFNLDFKRSTALVAVLFSILYICLLLKKALIWLVHLYQHYAPDRIRLKCVFEPSCSEYMILSIQKYGVIRGVLKGIYRLLRCHPPNGGHDEP